MAQVTIVLDTSKPDDLETLLKAFGSLPGGKTLTIDTAAPKKDKPKDKETPVKEEPKTEAADDVADALVGEKVDRDTCISLAKTKTGVKDLLTRMEAKDGKLSNIPDAQLGEFYKLCKELPNK